MPTTADGVVAALEALGVERVFGVPGGRTIELFDRFPDAAIDVVRPRDEREASVMAEAHGRLTGRPGVLVGQGPWVGSLGAMGLMEARLGSSPVVAITEASERGEYSTLAPYQQARGDYGGLSLPKVLDGVTKEWWFPRTPAETLRSLGLAFKHATAGRPGPTAVVLDGGAVSADLPDDPTPPVWPAPDQARTWTARPTAADVDAAARALADAERPVVVAGNGVHASAARAVSSAGADGDDPPAAYDALVRVAEAYGAAVVTSYLGKSTVAETHELAAGVVGAFGHEGANRVASEADVLLVVGCRLNPMDANWAAPGFLRPDEQTLLHADVDPRNAGWTYPADVGLVGDAGETLRALADHPAADDATAAATGWAVERAARAREDFSAPACRADASPVLPQRAVAEIGAVVDEDTVVTADSGNNRFWLLHYLQCPAAGTYYGSGGVGGMGWSPPAGVAAALATGREVVSVAGDGGFAMSLTSVETAVEVGVAPTFVVLNDASLGMVRQLQDGPGDIAGVESRDTDFAAVAEAFGAAGVRVDAPGDLADALRAARERDVPTVVDVRVDREEDMAERLESSFAAGVGGLHE